MASTENNIAATNDSRRVIYIVVGIASLVLIAGLAWLLMQPKANPNGTNQARLEGAIRAGSPEFEQYRKMLPLDNPEADEAGRPLGDIVMTLQTTVRNFTGRTITGLEMYAAVVDGQGKPVKERTVIVIPNRQAELEPNKTLLVPVKLEGMSKSDWRANIKMEVTAFKFK